MQWLSTCGWGGRVWHWPCHVLPHHLAGLLQAAAPWACFRQADAKNLTSGLCSRATAACACLMLSMMWVYLCAWGSDMMGCIIMLGGRFGMTFSGYVLVAHTLLCMCSLLLLRSSHNCSPAIPEVLPVAWHWTMTGLPRRDVMLEGGMLAFLEHPLLVLLVGRRCRTQAPPLARMLRLMMCLRSRAQSSVHTLLTRRLQKTKLLGLAHCGSHRAGLLAG